MTYDEMPGGHERDFWDTQIKKSIDGLPLDEVEQGFSSGAVDQYEAATSGHPCRGLRVACP